MNTTNRKMPRAFFARAVHTVLGKTYDLSIAIVPPKEMKALNGRYRKKDTSTDILAFPLSKKSGDVYLSLPDVKKKAPKFGMTANDYLAYLFVNGLVHLKGYDHGKRMDSLEEKYCTQLKISHPH